MKILLADDDKMIGKICTNFAKKLGVDIEVVENGADAVKMADKGFDLILMDLVMEGMDGYEATTQIKNSAAKDVPVVAFSGDELEDDVMDKYGFECQVSKPMTKAVFQQLVDEYKG